MGLNFPSPVSGGIEVVPFPESVERNLNTTSTVLSRALFLSYRVVEGRRRPRTDLLFGSFKVTLVRIRLCSDPRIYSV